MEWSPVNCPYYPCHFPRQSCDFCYCPFYPCKDESLGEWSTGTTNGRVWNCSRCTLLHEPGVADYLKCYPDAPLEEAGSLQKETKKRKLFLDPESLQELGERDAMCLGGLTNGLAAGDGASDTSHSELEEGLGGFRFFAWRRS